MAPYSLPQIFSRDTTDDVNGPVDGSSSSPSPVTPEVIAGILFACSIILGLCVWLGVRYYRKRTRQPHDLIVKGVISEGDSDDKAIPRCVSILFVMPFRRE